MKRILRTTLLTAVTLLLAVWPGANHDQNSGLEKLLMAGTAQADLPIPSCPWLPADNQRIFSFPESLPEYGLNLPYVTEGDQIAINNGLPAGMYNVRLASYDDHTSDYGGCDNDHQDNERWFVRFSDGIRTEAIRDIPDCVNFITQDMGNISLSGEAEWLQVVHTRDDENYAESVLPICMAISAVPMPPQPSCTLTADPTTIDYGDSSTLTWTTNNAHLAYIDQGIGPVSVDGGNTVVSPTGDTTYTMTVSNKWNMVGSCEATITVNDNPAPSCTLTADPTSIYAGENSTLSWTTTNATEASIDGSSVTPVSAGSLTVEPSVTTTYLMQVSGPGGSGSCSATVTVENLPPVLTCEIIATPDEIDLGQSSLLEWTSENGERAMLNGVEVDLEGEKTIWPEVDTEYTLAVFNNNKDSVFCTAKVIVHNEPQAPTCDLWADPQWLQVPGESELKWVISGEVNYIEVDQGVGEITLGVNSWAVTVDETTTYTMTVRGPGGEGNCDTTIFVDTMPPPPTCTLTANPEEISPGSSSTLIWDTEYAESILLDTVPVDPDGKKVVRPAETTRYELLALGSGGQSAICSATVTVTDNPPLPYCEIKADPTDIDPGQESELSWWSENASRALLNGIEVELNGNRMVRPLQTTTYTLAVFNDNKDSYLCSATVTVGGGSQLPTCELSADPNQLPVGGGLTILSWETRDTLRAKIDHGIGSVELPDGSRRAKVSQSTLFTMTVVNEHGKGTCTATVTVGDVVAPSCRLTTRPAGAVDPATTLIFNLEQTGGVIHEAQIDQNVAPRQDYPFAETPTAIIYEATTYTATVYDTVNNLSGTCQIAVAVNDPGVDPPFCTLEAWPRGQVAPGTRVEFVLTLISGSAHEAEINHDVAPRQVYPFVNGNPQTIINATTNYKATMYDNINNLRGTCTTVVKVSGGGGGGLPDDGHPEVVVLNDVPRVREDQGSAYVTLDQLVAVQQAGSYNDSESLGSATWFAPDQCTAWLQMNVSNKGSSSVNDVHVRNLLGVGQNGTQLGQITRLAGAKYDAIKKEFIIDHIAAQSTRTITYMQPIMGCNPETHDYAYSQATITSFESIADAGQCSGVGQQDLTYIALGNVVIPALPQSGSASGLGGAVAVMLLSATAGVLRRKFLA